MRGSPLREPGDNDCEFENRLNWVFLCQLLFAQETPNGIGGLSALEGGQAAENFGRMVAAHGGPADLMDRPAEYLARAPVVQPLIPRGPGRVQAMDVRAIGMTIVRLGGGRRHADEAIDAAVGLSAVAGLGQEVGDGAPLAMVHARDEASAEEAAEALRTAITVSDQVAEAGGVVLEVIPPEDSP